MLIMASQILKSVDFTKTQKLTIKTLTVNFEDLSHRVVVFLLF